VVSSDDFFNVFLPAVHHEPTFVTVETLGETSF
jgi:hypothetical protein